MYRMTLKNGATYTLTDEGAVVSRSDGPHGWDYSGKWVIVGFGKRHHSRELISLEDAANGFDVGHGIVHDLDHGTHRAWAHPVGRQVRSITKV